MQKAQLEINIILLIDEKGDFTAICPKCNQEIKTKETNVKSISLNIKNGSLEFFLEETQECQFDKKNLTYVIIPISETTKLLSIQKNQSNTKEEMEEKDKSRGNVEYSDSFHKAFLENDYGINAGTATVISTFPPIDPHPFHPLAPGPEEEYEKGNTYLDYFYQDNLQRNSPVKEIARFSVELEKMNK